MLINDEWPDWWVRTWVVSVWSAYAGWGEWMICAHGSQASLLWWCRCLNLKYFVNIIMMICCELILATTGAKWKYHRNPVCPDEVQWQWQVVFHKLCYSKKAIMLKKKDIHRPNYNGPGYQDMALFYTTLEENSLTLCHSVWALYVYKVIQGLTKVKYNNYPQI